MRTNRDGQRRFFVNVFKFAILLMCFATVFAVVLTAGVFDTGFDSGANVAEAGTVGTEAAMPETAYSSVFNNTLQDFNNEWHGESSPTSVTWTLNLSTISFSGYMQGHSDNDVTAYVYGGNVAGNYNGSFGAYASRGYEGVSVAANITIPSSIQSLASAGWNVTASWSANLFIYDEGDQQAWMGLIGSTTTLGGDDVWNRSNSDDTTMSWNKIDVSGDSADYTAEGNHSSGSTTISSGQSVLTLGLHRSSGSSLWRRAWGACVNNVTITFVISNPAADNNAPQASEFSISEQTTIASGYSFGGMSGEISGVISASYTDTASADGINLDKAIVPAGGITGVNTGSGTASFAKSVSMTLQDRNTAGGAANPAEATYYAGLASVDIQGDGAEVSTEVVYDNTIYTPFTYGDGQSGLIVYTTADARSSGTLTLYFSGNARSALTLRISDSGGAALTITVNVGGIIDSESVGSASVLGQGSSVGTSMPSVWVNGETAGFTFNGASSSYPLVWFYTVRRADTQEELNGISADEGFDPKTAHPFANATSNATTLTYSFGTGYLNGHGVYADGSAGGTGSGYYRFTFYALDYAGNVVDTVTNSVMYAKADVEGITNASLEEKYENAAAQPADGDRDEIGLIQDGETVYVGTSVTVTIKFKQNFSGNRVQVLGADGEEYIICVLDGITAVRTSGGAVATAWTGEGNTRTMTGDIYSSVKATLSVEGGICTLTLTYEGVPGQVSEDKSVFAVKSGADQTSAFDSSSDTSYSWSDGRNGGDGVYVYIDLDRPSADLADADGHFLPANADGSVENTVWHTKWGINGVISVEGKEFKNLYYTSPVRYESESAFKDGFADFAAKYAAAAVVGGENNLAALFGNVRDKDAFADNKYENWSANVSEAGYWVVYIAVTDRTSGKSDLYAFGILVDANAYVVSVEVPETYKEVLGEPFTETVNGDETVTVKRGEEVTLSLSLDRAGAGAYNAYIPYRITADGTVVYSDETAEESDILGTGTFTMQVTIDNDSPFAAAGTDGGENRTFVIEYSYRRALKADYTTSSATYAGAEVKPNIRLRDKSTSTTVEGIAAENLPYDFTITSGQDRFYNAGDYTYLLNRADNDYYVLMASGETGDPTVTAATFTINRAPLTITVVAGAGKIYGEVTDEYGFDGFDITLSGLVGADERKTIADIGTGGKFAFAGTAVSGYVNVGSHAVTYTGASASNYTITVQNGYLTVSEREIAVEAQSPTGTITYGEAMPTSYVAAVPKSVFTSWDTLGLYDEANEIAAIFGGAEVNDGGENWLVTLEAGWFVLDGEVNGGGYYNVGEYGFASFSFDDEDSNFGFALAEEGNGTVTVVTREVTISPISENLTAESRSDLGNVQVRFSTTDETRRFGITGSLRVVSAEEGNVFAIDISNTTFIDVAHNDYKSDNIRIVVEEGTVTITFRDETGGTFTFYFDELLFTTVFGTAWDVSVLEDYEMKFTVNGEEAEAPGEASFEATISSSYSGALSNVGSYDLTFGNYTVTGAEASQYEFRFLIKGSDTEVTALTVTPLTVTVGTVTVAGSTEKTYGDREPSWNFVYDFDGLLPEEYAAPEIGGVYRANADGTAAGDRYDDAGEYGVFFKGYYYNDENLVIKFAENAFENVNFIINKKLIVINENNVVGAADKHYDGNSSAEAGIDISAQILNGDNVTLAYEANYSSNGTDYTSDVGEGLYIIFTGIALGGDDAGNYYINIESLSTEAKYAILEALIEVSPDYFTFGKVYDGNNDVEPGDITLDVQNFVLAGRPFTVIESELSSENVGQVVVDMTIMFTDFAWSGGNYEDRFIIYDGITIGSNDGMLVIRVTGIYGTISPLTLTADDVNVDTSEDKMTKVYDGTSDVEVSFAFGERLAQAVTGFGDGSEVGMTIAANTSGKDVGKYAVNISDVRIASGNYVLTEDFANALAAKINSSAVDGEPFEITPRELSLTIDFSDAVYNGESDLSSESGVTITVGNTLADEGITVKSDGAFYSDAEGNRDPYVQGDASTGYLHHVTVEGLSITFEGDGNFLTNYTIGGTEVTDNGDGTYSIAQYTIKNAAVLKPVEIIITLNTDVSVVEKTYDGTRNAKLALDESVWDKFVLEKDRDYVVFGYTAAFAGADAGTWSVQASNFKVEVAEGGDAGIGRSYIFGSVNPSLTGTIVPAPLSIDLDLRDVFVKTYDGNTYASIDSDAIEAALNEWLKENNYSGYYINVQTAGFSDANVNPTGNEGFVYGVELVNNSNGAVNYKLDVTNKSYHIVTVDWETLEGDDVASVTGKLLAEYTVDGITYYLTEEDLTAINGVASVDTVGLDVIEVTGTINPVNVSFTVSAEGSVSKEFDDTTSVVLPEDGFSYTVNLESEDGSVWNAEGYSVVLAYADANVGSGKAVVFTISGGTGNQNYVFNEGADEGTYVVEGVGEITANHNPLKAVYGGADRGTYGETIGDYSVEYSFNGREVIVASDDGDGNTYAYMKAEDWMAAFGHGSYAEYTDGRVYTYDETSGIFTLAPDAEQASAYIRLNGTVDAATLVTSDGTPIVNEDGIIVINASDEAYGNCYVDVQAVNFAASTTASVFNFSVARRNLTVSVSNMPEGGFSVTYMSDKVPVPEFELAGVASIDDAATLAGLIEFVFRGASDITDAETLSAADIGDYRLVIDNTLMNYNVTTDAEYKLTVTLPVLTKEYKTTGEKKVYDSEALGISDIANLDGYDEFTIEWKQGDTVLGSAPVNAGEYTYTLTITARRIPGDSRNYAYDGNYPTIDGSFVIEQRSVTVNVVGNLGKTYDGNPYTIDTSQLTAKDTIDGTDVSSWFFDEAVITYTLNGETLTAMTDAGAYFVNVIPNEDVEQNYTIDNKINYIRISKAPVVVTVDAASRTHDVTDGSDGCEITFTAQGLDTDDFTVTYRNSSGVVVSSVTTAGVYTYTITSNDPNYYVSGGGTGNLTATISRVTYTVDEIDYVTVDFGDNPVTVNYTLNNSIVAEGTSFWNIVDSNVQALATEDEVLTTSGIVNVDMLNGNTYVSTLGNEVTVTVRMPDGVSGDYRVYYVTSNGELAELSDYTVSNGYITYTTNYISDLVFVNVSAPGLVWWIWPLIAALAILIIAIAILVAVLVKLHRAPDPVPVEVAPIDSIMPAPVAPAPVDLPVAAADIEPVNYDAPAAVSKHRQPPTIGIR